MNHTVGKTILCFGDSNTWGADPTRGPRFDRNTRWPCILQKELGADYHVIEEGLGGRTTVFDDPLEGSKNGLKHLEPILQTHKPLDTSSSSSARPPFTDMSQMELRDIFIGGEEKSHRLAAEYKKTCDAAAVSLFNAGDVIQRVQPMAFISLLLNT